MHCQCATAECIVARSGDYQVAVKTNQPARHEDVKLFLDHADAPTDDINETVDGYHGRIETRGAEVSRNVGWLRKAHSWPGLNTVGKITSSARAAGECTTVQ